MLFCVLRVPVMYRQPGGQDEDFYAVPGLTILEDGIPRLPHVPARNPESAFFMADQALYSEPPLYFYIEAAFYLVLPHVYGTARLVSGVAGLLLLGCVYRLARSAGAGPAAALAGVGLLSVSRWFYFPAISARPDMLCGLLGMLAIMQVVRWRESQRTSTLVLAGVWLGLGGLSHFFAIIYAVQLAFVVAWSSRRWRRLINPGILALVAMAVFSVWLPMIAIAPQAFQVQLANQLGGESGGPLWQRAVLPFAAMSYQLPMLWEQIGAIQCIVPGAALVWGALSGHARRSPVQSLACRLAWTAIYLICVFVGTHHPVFGYWVYPAALMFVCLACGMQRLAEVITTRLQRTADATRTASRLRTGVLAGIAGVIGLAFLPGSGVRTWYVHLQHWNDINYDAPRFAKRLIDGLAPETVCAVDAQFLLDFIAADRPALMASTHPVYFRVDQFDYDRLIVSRHGIEQQLAEQLNARLLRTEGIKEDRFACYVEIYAAAEAGGESVRNTVGARRTAGPYSIRDGITEIQDAGFGRSLGDCDDLCACYAELYREPAAEPAR